MAKIEIAPEGRSWAIKHDGGYLGFVSTREEAEDLAQMLARDRGEFGRRQYGGEPGRSAAGSA